MNASAQQNVFVIHHPLVQHKLTLMRNKETSTSSFRRLMNEVSMLMAYEVTHDMAMQEIEIETPLERMKSRVIDGKKLVFVSILRAGNGILEGMLSVIPGARVALGIVHLDLADPDFLARGVRGLAQADPFANSGEELSHGHQYTLPGAASLLNRKPR